MSQSACSEVVVAARRPQRICRAIRAALPFICLVAVASPALAIDGSDYDHEWTGLSTSNGNWTDATNWIFFNKPGSGDVVTLDGTPARTTISINSGSAVREIYFLRAVQGSNIRSSFTINGPAYLTVTDGFANFVDRAQTINAPVQFDGDGEISNSGSDGGYGSDHEAMTFNGQVYLHGHAVTVKPSSHGITLNGEISGGEAGTSLNVEGSGTVTLAGSNTWFGGLNLFHGTLSHGAGANLGSINNLITFNQTDSSSPPVLLRTGNGTTSGPLNFSSGEGRLGVAAGITVNYTGTFYGGGDLGKVGTGTAVLAGDSGFNGTTGNTGKINVYEGTLRESGVARLPSNLISVSTGATLALDDGIVDLIGSLSGGGSVQLGIASGLNVGVLGNANSNKNGTGIFSGAISGTNAAISKQGAGVMTLSGASSYSGTTSVGGGTLFLDNTSGSATGTSTISVANGAILAGDGSAAGGVTLAPGATIKPTKTSLNDDDIGTLSVGSLSAPAGTTVAIRHDEHSSVDKLSVAGDATLGGQLALSSATHDLIETGSNLEIVHVGGTRNGIFATVSGVSVTPTRSLAVTYTPHSVSLTVARPGDANLDGSVVFSDLVVLAQKYGLSTGQTWVTGDFNGSGGTDFADLVLLAKNYGSPAAFQSDWALAQSVAPEPTTLASIASLACIALRRRRR